MMKHSGTWENKDEDEETKIGGKEERKTTQSQTASSLSSTQETDGKTNIETDNWTSDDKVSEENGRKVIMMKGSGTWQNKDEDEETRIGGKEERKTTQSQTASSLSSAQETDGKTNINTDNCTSDDKVSEENETKVIMMKHSGTWENKDEDEETKIGGKEERKTTQSQTASSLSSTQETDGKTNIETDNWTSDDKVSEENETKVIMMKGSGTWANKDEDEETRIGGKEERETTQSQTASSLSSTQEIDGKTNIETDNWTSDDKVSEENGRKVIMMKGSGTWQNKDEDEETRIGGKEERNTTQSQTASSLSSAQETDGKTNINTDNCTSDDKVSEENETKVIMMKDSGTWENKDEDEETRIGEKEERNTTQSQTASGLSSTQETDGKTKIETDNWTSDDKVSEENETKVIMMKDSGTWENKDEDEETRIGGKEERKTTQSQTASGLSSTQETDGKTKIETDNWTSDDKVSEENETKVIMMKGSGTWENKDEDEETRIGGKEKRKEHEKEMIDPRDSLKEEWNKMQAQPSAIKSTKDILEKNKDTDEDNKTTIEGMDKKGKELYADMKVIFTENLQERESTNGIEEKDTIQQDASKGKRITDKERKISVTQTEYQEETLTEKGGHFEELKQEDEAKAIEVLRDYMNKEAISSKAEAREWKQNHSFTEMWVDIEIKGEDMNDDQIKGTKHQIENWAIEGKSNHVRQMKKQVDDGTRNKSEADEEENVELLDEEFRNIEWKKNRMKDNHKGENNDKPEKDGFQKLYKDTTMFFEESHEREITAAESTKTGKNEKERRQKARVELRTYENTIMDEEARFLGKEQGKLNERNQAQIKASNGIMEDTERKSSVEKVEQSEILEQKNKIVDENKQAEGAMAKENTEDSKDEDNGINTDDSKNRTLDYIKKEGRKSNEKGKENDIEIKTREKEIREEKIDVERKIPVEEKQNEKLDEKKHTTENCKQGEKVNDKERIKEDNNKKEERNGDMSREKTQEEEDRMMNKEKKVSVEESLIGKQTKTLLEKREKKEMEDYRIDNNKNKPSKEIEKNNKSEKQIRKVDDKIEKQNETDEERNIQKVLVQEIEIEEALAKEKKIIERMDMEGNKKKPEKGKAEEKRDDKANKEKEDTKKTQERNYLFQGKEHKQLLPERILETEMDGKKEADKNKGKNQEEEEEKQKRIMYVPQNKKDVQENEIKRQRMISEENQKPAKEKTESKVKHRDRLRYNIMMWLKQYRHGKEHNNAICSLAKLKQTFPNIQEYWTQDVLYLRDIQKFLTRAAKNLEGRRGKKEELDGLKDILKPYYYIDVAKFPDIKDIIRIIEPTDGRTGIEKVVSETHKILRNNLSKFNIGSAVADQLHFLTQKQEESYHPQNNVPVEDLKASVAHTLEKLGLTKYYPQKLKYEDVIKLTSADTTGPETMRELPWYFVKQIIGLNGNAREKCHIKVDGNRTAEDSSDEDERETDVHPLDLIYAIFLCADDFLRQELADKMSKCQYAIPMIIPSPCNGINGTKDLILHWGLKSISRIFYHKKNVVNKTVIDLETPMIACVNMGKETSWKSRLLNRLLSPQQETFWHQGLKGGKSQQTISNGMVEVVWSLPGMHKEDKFPYPVTFTNLRHNAAGYDGIFDVLHKSSSVTCLFVNEIDDHLDTIMDKRRLLVEKLILVVLCKPEMKTENKKKLKLLKEKFSLDSQQVILKTMEDENFDSALQLLKEAIKKIIAKWNHAVSVTTFMLKATEEDTLESDNNHCYLAKMAAESILGDVDQCNSQQERSAKSKILPSQSDLKSRQEIGALDKELIRQRNRQKDTTVQNYAFNIKEMKWKLQQKQLQHLLSKTFRYFLQCLINFETCHRKYFLQYLKLGLNERSVQQLQPLYEEYDKCRKTDNTHKHVLLKEIDAKLTHGSLGIEHFFREMAILYDNFAALKKKKQDTNLQVILNRLSKVMAEILLEGTAIEIMDGDAIDVPVTWLTAVFNQLTEICVARNLQVFKVSTLGAQSCGKSTLLNSLFGLNFTVSSGRCTKGAYMHLIQVDEMLKKRIHCDYVAVIDSEGLMSRTKTDDSSFDNELATFIIGLSDLTLVIFKGEGREMADVLPMAIHVFLRMNVVGEHQACHFVHQNMGAVDAMTKVASEIDTFVHELNQKTEAVAKDVKEYTRSNQRALRSKTLKFTDIIQYDSSIDNTYVAGLWDGALPMCKVNTHYAHQIQELKSTIIAHILALQNRRLPGKNWQEKFHIETRLGKQKKLSTFGDLAKRLDELWDAIKYENFVLSFKNVLAIEAHRKLTKIFDDEQFKIKRDIRKIIQEEKNFVENGANEKEMSVAELIDVSSLKLTEALRERIEAMTKKVLHYFKCIGCKEKECDASITNRHLLLNNQLEFETDIRYLKTTLLREISSVMDTLKIKMETNKRIHNMSKNMDDNLRRKVQEAISTGKSKMLNRKEDIEEYFDNLWTGFTLDILNGICPIDQESNIEAVVEGVVEALFKDDDHIFKRRHITKEDTTYYTQPFIVNEQHVSNIKGEDKSSWFKKKVQTVMSYIPIVGKQEQADRDILRLQKESDTIIEETSKYYSDSEPLEGKQFSQKEAEMLFKDVKDRVGNIRDKFHTTIDYEVDLIYYIEELAVEGFRRLHKMYRDNNSPEALLTKKKKGFRDVFLIKMGQGNAAVKFSETVLKDIILKNIDKELSCTELLHDLRSNCGLMFTNIKSMQGSIMVSLYKENTFDKFKEYIWKYEAVLKQKIEEESKMHFQKNSQLQKLAQVRLGKLVNALVTIVEETEEKMIEEKEDKSFIKNFLKRLDKIKIKKSHDEAVAFLELDVPEPKNFAAIIKQQLRGAVKEDIKQTLNTWNVGKKLQEKNFTSFVFSEVVGCSDRCPFCAVPCDNHTGGKRSGNHSAILHRPAGLGGNFWHNSNKLLSSDCCSEVASSHRFKNSKTKGEWKNMKDYQEYYPNWTIYGDAEPDVEKYWKWVFAQYKTEFAKFYNKEEPEIPEQWSKYSKNDIKEDIESNYKIRLDSELS